MAVLVKLGWALLKKAVKDFIKQKAMELASDSDFIKKILIIFLSVILAIPIMIAAVLGGNPTPSDNSGNTGSVVSLADGIWALSSKYEGGGDPGICSTGAGDPGGMSCGAFQIAKNPGTLQSFISFLKGGFPQYYATLGNDPLSYVPFAQDWRNTYNSGQKGFFNAQEQFIAADLYLPVMNSIKKKYGFDPSTHPLAVQEMFWSYSVQHGYNTVKAFDASVGSNWSNMTDQQIITNMYDYRIAHWSCCTRRFVSEKADALALLAQGAKTS